MHVEIKSWDDLNHDEIAFLRRTGSIPFTQIHEYAKYFSGVFNVRAFFVFVRKEKILSSMLFFQCPLYYRWLAAKIPGLLLLNKLPFALSISSYNLPGFAESLSKEERLDCFKHILRAIIKFSRRALRINFYEVNDMYRTLFVKNGFSASTWATYVTNISASKEDLWNKLHKNVRTAVRKAEKDGLTFKEIHNAHAYYKILKEDARRTKKLVIDRVKDVIADTLHNKFVIYGVFKGKKLLAAQYVFIHNKRAHIAALARSDECYDKKYTAGELLQWHSMLEVKKKGILWYDVSGVDPNPAKSTKAYGIKKFKSQFGGTFKTYMNFCKTNSRVLKFLTRSKHL